MSLLPFGSAPTPNATSSKLGKIQLAGDITGSATAPTIKSSVFLSGNPTTTTQSAGDNTTKIATDAFVTTAINNAIAGVNPATAVQAATTAASDTSGLTYNNGVSGIGATFTGSNNTALTFDGFTFTTLNQRALIKNDTQVPSGAFNGIYYVTQIQTAILPPILTRVLDYDQPSDMNNTGAIPVVNGTVNGGTSWLLTSTITAVGTDPLTFTQFSLNPTTLVTLTGTQVLTNKDVTSGTNTFPTFNQNTSGSAATLTTGRTIAVTGDLAYTSPSFNGSTNVTAVGTLATVNTNVGSFGSVTAAPQFTVNGKGLITAASTNTITPAVGSITGLGTGVGTFLATPTSANLATALTDETGAGPAVFGTSPTIATPIISSPTIQNWDGWLADNHTWVFASSTTFTIAGVDLTLTFQPLTLISWNDGSLKYGVVKSSTFSTNTTVTIMSTTDYTIANATITAPRYSYYSRPQGFPGYFNWAPALTGYSANPTTTAYVWFVSGTGVHVSYAEQGNGTSNATTKTYAIPINQGAPSVGQWGYTFAYFNNGTRGTVPGLCRILGTGSVVDTFIDFNATAWTNSGGARIASMSLIYPPA